MLLSTVGKWKLLPWEIPNVSIEVRAVACLRARDWGLRTLSSASHWLWAAPAGHCFFGAAWTPTGHKAPSGWKSTGPRLHCPEGCGPVPVPATIWFQRPSSQTSTPRLLHCGAQLKGDLHSLLEGNTAKGPQRCPPGSNKQSFWAVAISCLCLNTMTCSSQGGAGS